MIVFTNNHKLVAHRLLSVDFDKGMVLSKGDGLLKEDNILAMSAVHGVVIHHYRDGEEICFVNHRWMKQMITIFTPLMGYLTFPLARIWYKMFR